MNTLKIPISVKGIVLEDGKVWLRKNGRGEWELPGGKIDPEEQPKETCQREIKEELGFEVEVQNLIDACIVKINESIDEKEGVLILIYSCQLISKTGDFEHIGESGIAEFKLFEISEIEKLENMLEFYKRAVRENQF